MLTRQRLIIAIASEVTYAVLTRLWLPRHYNGIPLELAISAFRLATIFGYWALFRDLIHARLKSPATLRRPTLGAGIAAALVVPLLFQGWSPGGGLAPALVFALTSIVVGLREELLYRSVLLNGLQPRLGTAGALACSSALFVVYHYGAQPFTWLTLTEMASMSLMLGLIYIRSGSLLAVAAIHAVYDALWFIGPAIKAPLPDVLRPVFLILALAMVVAWSHATRRT